jgi:putative two-component system response regulator
MGLGNFRHLDILWHSHKIDTAFRHRALILGADDFLTKPLDRHDVVLRVRNQLRTRQVYLELAEANDALERQLQKRESDTAS